MVNELIDEGFLKIERKDGVHFVYRSDIRYITRQINARLKIIKNYSNPIITRALGEHAEMLFSFLFRIHGFEIRGRNINEFNGVKWETTNHDLDFIIEKDAVAYGVEIKNTLPYMERDEFDIKLKMCERLNLIPLWILRNAPAIQFEQMKPYNGFILKFKTQTYPLGQEPLVKDIWQKTRLPIAIWKEIPKRIENIFLSQHNQRIGK
ncbi:MAG: hypothetical protein HY930_04445 [Euryarchaeota archaeon]|nr:hypothetical protein [Euryarchaeota archaeon]